MLPQIRPMRLKFVKRPFDSPDYIFELKHDGFRAIAYINNGDCRLESRNLKPLLFKSLRASLASISLAKNAILDGEIIVLDSNGVSRFNSLLSRKSDSTALFYAFDLLWLNRTDLRQLPLVERKKRLHKLVQNSQCQRLLCAGHIDGIFGQQFFEEICRRDLKGIVARRKLSIYRDDANTWLQIKNKNYSQAEGRDEMLTQRR